jgi:hypothetical protein
LVRQRVEALKGVALQLGLTYEGDDWFVSNRAPQLETPLFDKKTEGQIRNIISGERDGQPCSFFDYTFAAGRTSISQTLAVFTQGIWLPQFAITPQGLVGKIADAMFRNVIHFDSDPSFSKRFRLQSVDPGKTRELFTPPILGFFDSFPAKSKWQIQGAGTTLVIYREGVKVSSSDFRAFVEETTRIAKTFFDLCGLKNSGPVPKLY